MAFIIFISPIFVSATADLEAQIEELQAFVAQLQGQIEFSNTQVSLDYPWPHIGGGPDYHILELEPGWNIVSTPRILLSHEFSVPGTVDNFDIYVLDSESTSGWNTIEGIGQNEFTPLYAYFINNKTNSSQTLRFNYDFELTSSQRLFQRTLNPGWNIVGITLPDNILTNIKESSLLWIDFTENQGSLSVSESWKDYSRPEDIDVNYLKGYAVFIKAKTDNYIGYQNLNDFSVTEINIYGEGDATTLMEGSSLQMTVEVLPKDSSNKEVIWSVVNGIGEAEINSEGLLIGIKEGSVMVKATATDGSGIVGEKEITITSIAIAELELKLNENSPEEGIAITDSDNTTQHELLRFDVKATKDSAKITEIKFEEKGGLGVNDVVAYKLYDGSTLLGSESYSATPTFSSLEIEIAKDSTKTLTVEVEMNKAVNGVTSYVSITPSSSHIVAISGSEEEVIFIDDSVVIGNITHFYEAAPVISNITTNITETVQEGVTTTQLAGTINFTLTAQGGDVVVTSTAIDVKVATSGTDNIAPASSLIKVDGKTGTAVTINSGTSKNVEISATLTGMTTNDFYWFIVKSLKWTYGGSEKTMNGELIKDLKTDAKSWKGSY